MYVLIHIDTFICVSINFTNHIVQTIVKLSLNIFMLSLFYTKCFPLKFSFITIFFLKKMSALIFAISPKEFNLLFKVVIAIIINIVSSFFVIKENYKYVYNKLVVMYGGVVVCGTESMSISYLFYQIVYR